MISHNGKQKKIAVINDISGFGRCSITVSLPIISHMKIQCCPFPTSIFSNHTGYPDYFFDDYTDRMPAYMEQWEKLQLTFDGIYTGFLGSIEQIRIVEEFIGTFRTKASKIIIDPVMGENGKLYPTYKNKMCKEMKRLVQYANVLTPNLTEACFLTDTPYEKKKWKREELFCVAEKLTELGPENVVISGISMMDEIGNIWMKKGGAKGVITQKKVGEERAGTGDVFSSILAADCVNGVTFEDSVLKAAIFVRECLEQTKEAKIPPEDGVCFEQILDKL